MYAYQYITFFKLTKTLMIIKMLKGLKIICTLYLKAYCLEM